MAWCLIRKSADKFLKAIKSGEIIPNRLMKMSSSERRKFLTKIVGEEDAKYVNTEFESKLLLKNQQAGLIRWAEKFSGLKDPTRKDIIAKIKKIEKAFNPDTDSGVLEDIIQRRFKIKPTDEEAKTITKLANEADALYNEKLGEFKQSRDYYKARLKVIKYIDERTPEVTALTKAGLIKRFGTSILSVMRSIKTGFDFSFPLRQGYAYTGTREWRGALRRMFAYAKSDLALDELKLNMMTNKYAEQVMKYKKDLGLTVLGESMTQREEQFMSKFVDKIPLLGGSERAFTGFASDLRFHRFVNILERLDKAGRGITDNPEAMKKLAEVISASSGRGKVGVSGRALSTVLFSPRWIKSRIQLITNITKTGAAGKEARLALARAAGITMSLLAMYKASGGDVELDTRSTNFGKIKIGNTRFDVSGGLAPYIVLFSRIGTLSTKTSIGEIKKLNTTKFGAQTAFDTLSNFATNKAAPVPAAIRDILKGKEFGGKPLKIGSWDSMKYIGDQLFTPLIADDTYQAYADSTGSVGLTATAGLGSLFGVGVNTYSTGTDWTFSDSKELKKFKEKVGEQKFEEANDKFNKLYQEKAKKLVKDNRYKELSDDKKAALKNNLQNIIKKKIFKKYGFIYKAEKTSKKKTKVLKEITNNINL